jgi:hypothetical protein
MIKRRDIRSVVGLAHNSLHLISPTKQRGPFTLVSPTLAHQLSPEGMNPLTSGLQPSKLQPLDSSKCERR